MDDATLSTYQAKADSASALERHERIGISPKKRKIWFRFKRKPKVILIHPPFIEDPQNPTTHDCLTIHGLGLMISHARRKGYEIPLIDNRRLNDWDLFRERLSESEAEIIGIGSTTADYDQAQKCARIAKEVLPKAKIIFGGPHPSLATNEVASNQDIDHILIGDGEITFVDLIEAIHRRYSPRRIIYGQRPILDTMPFVDRDVFERKEHLMAPIWFGSPPWVSMITSRGCLFNCLFCAPASRIMFGKKVRRRSPFHVIEELKVLREECSFNHIRFYDDNIIEDMDWTLEFCDLYRKNSFSATFGIAGRADLICKREQLVAKLAEAGLIELNIGFESGSQRILDFLNKRTTVEQNINSAEILRKFGVKIIVSVMFGIPGETREDVLKTIELIDTVQPDWVDPSLLTPYPGTGIYEYCQERDINLAHDGESYKRNPGSLPKIKGIDYDFAVKALGNRAGPRENWTKSRTGRAAP
jgi:anaerobic magnesium-protoporphyrin IX monomethyl ester cyclase